MDYPGLEFTESDRQVFLRCQPLAQRPPVDPAALLDLLAQAGYGQCLLLQKAITDAANDCNTRQEPFEVKLAERRDSVIGIKISKGDMAAELSLTPPQGGTSASEQDVVHALSEAGVTFGIDSAAIAQACAFGSCQGLVVASGVAAVNGVDTIFEELIPKITKRGARLDENGRIDYREHSSVIVVHAGALLMRRIAATVGFDGYTVRARVLPAKHGRDRPFTLKLVGSEVASDDPNVMKAAISGQPVRVDGGVMVEPVLHLANVNMASGNIHFDGTVDVAGEVSHDMKIEASGDIVVAGLVDGAVLRSGGDIRVASGVIANAKLYARGSVVARFAQSSQIEARGLIALSEMALECELDSLDQIIIGSDSPKRGRLRGGVTNAMMLLSVPLLGAAQGAVTRVVMGVNLKLEARHKALLLRINQERANEAKLEKLSTQLTAKGDPKGMLERVTASLQNAAAVCGKSIAEQVELEAQMELARTARLEVSVAVAGAVDLSFGKLTVPVRREFDAGAFWLDAEDQIVYTDQSGIAVAADSLLL
jgi:uncharacterized protein (DUF342 family)